MGSRTLTIIQMKYKKGDEVYIRQYDKDGGYYSKFEVFKVIVLLVNKDNYITEGCHDGQILRRVKECHVFNSAEDARSATMFRGDYAIWDLKQCRLSKNEAKVIKNYKNQRF